MSGPLRILVALDGTPGAETILAALMPLVRLTAVEPVLFTAVEDPSKADEARAYLARMKKALELHRLGVQARVDYGPPAPTLLAALKGGDFHLGAMTTHGRRGLDRVFMGSVAEAVVRESETPLIVARPDARVRDWKKIVVALDGSPEAEAVLDDVTDLARRTTAALHLFHVSEVLAAAPGVEYGYSAVVLPDMKPYLKRIADRLGALGLSVTTETRMGSPGSDIVRYADEVDAGLIALTTHGRSGLRRVIMGSVAEHVLRKAPCAVFVKSLGTRVKSESTTIE
jgi:nucleotide-binding universal stress UspA family protein